MNIRQAIKQSISSSVTRKGPQALSSRHFTLFDATAKSHITYETPFISDGNFEAEFNFYVTEVGSGNGFFAIYSDDPAEYLAGKLNNSGTDYQVKLQSDGVTPGQGTDNLADGKSHKANFKLSDDGTIEVFIDDVLAYASNHNDIARVIGTEYKVILGCLNNGIGNDTFSHLNGYIWDFKMWISGHKGTGTLWIDDPIDKPDYDVYSTGTYSQEPNISPNMDAPYDQAKVDAFSTTGGSTILTPVEGEIEVYRNSTSSSWLIRKGHTLNRGTYLVDIEYDMTDTWTVQNIGSYIFSHRDSAGFTVSKTGTAGRIRYLFDNDADGHAISIVVSSNSSPDDIGKTLRIKKFNVRPVYTTLASTYNIVEADYTKMSRKNGRWLGATLNSTAYSGVLGDSVDPEYFDTGVVPEVGKNYYAYAEIIDYTEANTDMGFSTQGNMPGSYPFRINSTEVNRLGNTLEGTFSIASSTVATIKLFGRDANRPTFDKVLLAETLEDPVLPKSRKFTKFDNISQSSISFDSPISLGLNWKIKVDFCVENLNSLRTILSNNNTGAQEMFGLRIDTDADGGRIRALLPRSGVSLSSRAWPHDNAGSIEPNVMHSVELSCVNGTDFTFIVDGIVATTTFNDIDTGLTLNRIGSTAPSFNHFIGYISDLYVEVDSVPRVSMPIDGSYQEDRANLVMNNLSELELLDFNLGVNGYITNESSDVEIEVGTDSVEIWRHSNTTGQFGWNFANITDTSEYILEFDVEVLTGSGMVQFWTNTWSGRGFSAFNTGEKFRYREKLYNIGRIRFKVADSGGIAHIRFTNIKIWKIREGKPCARADNFLLDDSRYFTYWNKGIYLGPELITQDHWLNPHNIASSYWTYEPNTDTWFMNSDEDPRSIVFVDPNDQPEHMFLAGNCLDLQGVGVSVSRSAPPYVIRNTGWYHSMVSKTLHGPQEFKRNVGAVQFRTSKPSLREVLEYKQ